MTLPQLNAEQLHGAILNGCQSIIKQQNLLNKINVFPVPDGDTGSNLSSTALAVMQYSQETTVLKDTLQSIAEASIIGARGNSGMIFSQFFNGLYESFSNAVDVTLNEFSKMLEQAACSVRAAISSPVEGTMLTIMEAWAHLVNQAAANVTCFKESLDEILPSLQKTVENTKEQLIVLKESDVVDAGALGFYYFVQGFSNYLKDPDIAKYTDKPFAVNFTNHQHPIEATPPTYRYCTEGVLKGNNIDKGALTTILNAAGDSIVISGSNTLCRFHVHTNTPERVFSQIVNFGTVKHPKIDDMQRQSEMAHRCKHPIALVMDSSADLPQEIIDHHQIHILPINLHLDEHDLLDGYSFDSNEFYRTLGGLENYPKTSMPSPGMIDAKLSQLADHYNDVIIITLSQRLSGTHDAIKMAADRYPNVHVVDSKNSTGAQGLLVKFAAELIEQQLDVETILKTLDQRINHARLFVAVEQFDSLIRSGRISVFKGKLAQFTGIKPIISVNEDGKGEVYSKALSSSKALTKLITCVNELCTAKKLKLKHYCIIHAGAPERAESLAKLTTKSFGQPPYYIKPVSTAIGLHAGLGAVAIAVLME